MTFLQYSHFNRCPICNGIHQINVRPALIECQPHLFNAEGTCSGQQVFFKCSDKVTPYDMLGRVGLLIDTQKESKVLEILGIL